MDEKGLDERDDKSTQLRCTKYKLALDKLSVSAPGSKAAGKGGKGSKGKKGQGPTEVVNLFKEKCDAMGVQFHESRLGDIAQLLAFIRARMGELDR